MIDMTKENIIAIGAGVSAIVAITVYFLLYHPVIGELNAARTKSEQYNMAITRARDVIKEAKKIDTKKIFITDKSLITEDRISSAIAELTGREDTFGINFVSITPGKPEEQDDPRYKILPVRLKIECEYDKFGTFMGLLDDMEEGLATVRSFNIIPSEDDQADLNVDLTVNLYLLSEYAR